MRNESARQLRAGTSRTLAYVMLDAGNPFFTDVAQGIEVAAEAVDLSLVLCNSNQRERARARAPRTCSSSSGSRASWSPRSTPSHRLLDEIRRRGTPVVIVDRTRDDPTFCSVAVDDLLGGRLAVEHLVDRGHERVAFVGGPMSLGQVRDRLEGARARLGRRRAGRPTT